MIPPLTDTRTTPPAAQFHRLAQQWIGVCELEQEDSMRAKLRMIVTGVLLVAGCAALSASLTAQAGPQLQIDSAAVKDGQVTLKGKNFGSSVAVTLVGEQSTPIAVLSASDTEITCQLPSVAPGVYVVRVTRDAGATPEGSAKTSLLIQ
jgi:hypothetical protein